MEKIVFVQLKKIDAKNWSEKLIFLNFLYSVNAASD